MREILFRGKTVDKGEWVEGWYGEKSFGAWPLRAAITPCDDARNGYLHYEEIIPETVGQYTGREDKNGQKIFEGDIIAAVLPDSKYQRRFEWPLMHVEFWKGSFFLATEHGSMFSALSGFSPYVNFEVVGNIHDNPEMLKGKKEGE